MAPGILGSMEAKLKNCSLDIEACTCIQLFPVLCDPMDRGAWQAIVQAPLSMGMLQARILEWVAMPFSRGSSQPRD